LSFTVENFLDLLSIHKQRTLAEIVGMALQKTGETILLRIHKDYCLYFNLPEVTGDFRSFLWRTLQALCSQDGVSLSEALAFRLLDSLPMEFHGNRVSWRDDYLNYYLKSHSENGKYIEKIRFVIPAFVENLFARFGSAIQGILQLGENQLMYDEFNGIVKSSFKDESLSMDNFIDWVHNIVMYKDSAYSEGAQNRFTEWVHGNLEQYDIHWEACRILRNFLAHSIQLPECGFAERDWLFTMSKGIWQNFATRLTNLVCGLQGLVSKYGDMEI